MSINASICSGILQNSTKVEGLSLLLSLQFDDTTIEFASATREIEGFKLGLPGSSKINIWESFELSDITVEWSTNLLNLARQYLLSHSLSSSIL